MVADGDPEPAGLDPLAVVVLHRHRRVVILDDLGGQDLAQHQLDDRRQQLGDDGHPVAHRRARQLDAEPLEDPFEAIERQVIGIFADRDVSHQPRAGQALLDRLGEPSAITTLASQAWQAYLGRMCSSTTSDAGMYSSCSRTSWPMQVRSAPQSGQTRCSGGTSCRTGLRGRLAGSGLRPWPFFLAALGAGRRGWGRLRGRGGCRRGLGLRQDLLGEEQELSRVDPLALPAVALAEELLELVLELLVEMDLLGERLQQLADELMGRLQVVREWVCEGDHTLYYVDACSIVGALFSEF